MAEFDFTGVSKATGGSVTLVDEGQYRCYVSKITKRVKENNNIVLDIDGEIQAGPFAGEKLRYFQTIVPARAGMSDTELGKLRKNWGFFLTNLEILGVLDEAEDREADGTLNLSFTYEKIGNDTEIVAAVVNGVSRKILGNLYLANVVHVEKTVDTAEGPKVYTNHRVDSLESAGATPEGLATTAPSLNPAAAASTAAKPKVTKKMPTPSLNPTPAPAAPTSATGTATTGKKLPW